MEPRTGLEQQKMMIHALDQKKKTGDTHEGNHGEDILREVMTNEQQVMANNRHQPGLKQGRVERKS